MNVISAGEKKTHYWAYCDHFRTLRPFKIQMISKIDVKKLFSLNLCIVRAVRRKPGMGSRKPQSRPSPRPRPCNFLKAKADQVFEKNAKAKAREVQCSIALMGKWSTLASGQWALDWF